MKLLKPWLTKPTIQPESTRMKKVTDYKHLNTSLVSDVEVVDTNEVAGIRLFDAPV